MELKRTVKAIAIACALIAAAISVWYGFHHSSSRPLAEVRVGVDHSPPFYLIQPDGSVRGLAVDVLNEAARRRNIHLIWTPLHDIPLDDALTRRIVQIWPLVGATPDRKNHLYFSKPWLESDYVLVSLKEKPIRTAHDADGQLIAQARLKLTTIIAHQYLSRSKLTVKSLRANAIQSVCGGEAVAAIVESRFLDAILLTRPAGCQAANFNIATLAGATTPLAIAAVPEAGPTAAALRDEISNLAADGFLSAKLDEWSPFSAEGTRSIWAEQAANDRSRIYRYCLLLILLLASILAWVAWRVWGLKQAAEQAESGRREVQRRFTAFMENSPAISYMKDAAGRILYVNRAWTEIFGLTAEQCYGKDDFDLWPLETARVLRANDIELLAGDEPHQVIEAVPLSDIDRRHFLVMKFPFENERGERFVGGTAIDITRREEAIRELSASEARYRELFEHNPLPAWVCDRATLEFLAVNDAAVRRYGWSREAFLGGMTLPDVLQQDEKHHAESQASGAWHHRTRDGLALSVHVSGYELEYERRSARLMIIRDLTEQERTLEQLRLSEERWQLALNGAGDALWDWDLISGRIFRSPRWNAMLGYPETAIGNSHSDFLRLLHPEDAEATLAALNGHLDRATPTFFSEYRLRHRNETWRWIMDRGQAIFDERGRPVRMAGSQTDITERKNAEQLLRVQARTDALTGLTNRREFDRLFADEVHLARLNGEHLAVCVCDIDQFKEVNDRYGHAAGDRVLRAFAAILRRHIRKSDLLARIGGDEFVIAMPRSTAAEACPRIEEMRRELNAAISPADDTSFRVSGSFGVAELRSSHADPAELLAEADRCLYEAKDAGRNRTLAAA